MSTDIKLGVLGLGRMGLLHCEYISATPGLTLTAASSRSRLLRNSAENKFSIRVYSSHDQLLQDSDLQWIVISTYSDQHKLWALKALSCGKSLIIEKPAALNGKEAEGIFSEAAKRGLKVTVHQNRRWDRDFLLVSRVLEENLLGEVYRIESRYTDFSTDWPGWGAQGMDNPWRLKSRFGGGMLFDWGPHLFDQLLLLSASPVRTVFGKLDKRIWSREVDDHFWAEILFENGLSARVEASNNFRIPLPRWCVVGTEGTMQVEGGDPESWHTAKMKRVFNGFPEEITFDITQPELSLGFYNEFSVSLHEQKPLPVLPEQVLSTMKLIDALRESVELARPVTVAGLSDT